MFAEESSLDGPAFVGRKTRSIGGKPAAKRLIGLSRPHGDQFGDLPSLGEGDSLQPFPEAAEQQVGRLGIGAGDRIDQKETLALLWGPIRLDQVKW